MTQEELNNVKAGDTLICTHGNWHFETGSEYKVYQDDLTPELIVWCDEIQVHFVRTLNPDHWSIKEEPKMREITWALSDAIEGAINEFTKEHPDYKVVVRLETHKETNKIELYVKPADKQEEKE